MPTTASLPTRETGKLSEWGPDMDIRAIRAALGRIAGDALPNVADLESLLSVETEAGRNEIFTFADAVRRRLVGDGVLLRGLVEFSSYCSNSCLYCGLNRSNVSIARYRLSLDEILSVSDAVSARGLGTIVLQSGEDGSDAGFIAEIVREIKARHDLAITLSVGERSRADYALWREAGADRYLLRIESSDPALYEALHVGRSFQTRLRCLLDLRELGYQVGSGVMVGLPGQTVGTLAGDIRFFKEMDFDMVGIGPFIPHPATPLRDAEPGTVDMTLKVIALTRIVTGNAHLPATTALGSMGGLDHRIEGLKAGANVIMPNFTPTERKRLYEIYPGKRCIEEPSGACVFCMEGLAASAGLHVEYSRGDSLKKVASPCANGGVNVS
jgi:biotin synthase